MHFAAIEVNDAGAIIATDGGLLRESPGYALFEQPGLRVGEQARRHARLQPRSLHDRFWEDLSSDPLPRPFLPTMSTADLAAAHLSHLCQFAGAQPRCVVLAAPASFSKDQLGLLLGIATRLSLPVGGLVDAATAAVDGSPPKRKLVHIEAQLHRIVITMLAHRDGFLIRESAHSLEHVGLKTLLDVWLERIADKFVTETRFDPLLRAESEQRLYNRLPQWLHVLASQSRTEVELTARDGTAYRVILTREEVVNAVEELYRRMLTGVLECCGATPVTLHVSHRLAGLPGCVPVLANAGETDVVLLPHGAAVRGALRHAQFLANSGAANTYTISLPALRQADPRAQGETQPSPTHVVYRGCAYALGERPFWLGGELPPGSNGIRLENAVDAALRLAITAGPEGVRCDTQNGNTLFVNERPVEGRVWLSVGDELRLGRSCELVQMIRLVERDETTNR